MRLSAPMWLAALAAGAWAQDRVTYRTSSGGEETVTGAIDEMTCDEIRLLNDAGIPQSAPSAQVITIRFSTGPSAMLRGIREMDQGQHAQALASFEAALRSPQIPPWAQQVIWFKTAECHQAAGNGEGMAEALNRLAQATPNSFYLIAAYEMRIRHALGGNDATAAGRVIQEAQTHVGQHRQHTWSGRIQLWQAEIALSQRDYATAIQMYTQATSDRDPAVREQARVMEIRAMLDSGNVGGARGRGDGVVNGGQEESDWLMTAAFNAIGAAHLEGGNPKEALKAFLRGVVLYNQRGERHYEHEYAIAYGAIAAWRTSRAVEASLTTEYENNARRLRTQLQSMYPGSRLAATVEQEMR